MATFYTEENSKTFQSGLDKTDQLHRHNTFGRQKAATIYQKMMLSQPEYHSSGAQPKQKATYA